MKKYLELISNKTKGKCLGIILLAALSSVLASVWPVKLGGLYTAVSDGTIGTLPQAALSIIFFGLIYLAAECIAIIRRVLLDCVIAANESEIRSFSLGKLLHMPASSADDTMSGEKAAQLSQGVSGFSQLLRIFCNDLFSTALIAVCTLVQVFLNAPPLMTVIMMLYLVLSIAISGFQIRSQNGIRERIVAQKNALDGQVCQAINNLEMIRSMNADSYEKNRLMPGIMNIRDTEQHHHRFMGKFDSLKQICKVAFQIGILAVSILMINQGKMSPGSVITVCLLFQQLIKPIEEVYRFMDETASSLVKSHALLKIVSAKEDPAFSIKSSGKKPVRTEIRVEDVTVTNPENTKAIAKYGELVFPCGKIIHLQGANGSGKTSLIRAIIRYYKFPSGYITLFGRDLSTYSQQELTSLIYYTPQVSFFIKGTVRENLKYGLDHTVTDEELMNALLNVGLTGKGHGCTVLHENPVEALDYLIGEKADELSGGMKQRLNLARAYLRNPIMYIFDEITANLDKDAEDYVLDNLEKYAKLNGAGIIYISHDEKVAKRCEMKVILHNKLQDSPVSTAA